MRPAANPTTTAAVTNAQSDVAIGDVTGDGRPDIVTLMAGAFTIAVFPVELGQQSLGSVALTTLPTQGGEVLYNVAVGLADGDNYADIGVTTNFAYLDLCYGKSDGTCDNVVPVGADIHERFAVAKWDSDSHSDIIGVRSDPTDDQGVEVLLYTSATPSYDDVAMYAVGDQPASFALADINGDVSLDVVTANGGSSSISTVYNKSPTTSRPIKRRSRFGTRAMSGP